MPQKSVLFYRPGWGGSKKVEKDLKSADVPADVSAQDLFDAVVYRIAFLLFSSEHCVQVIHLTLVHNVSKSESKCRK